MWKRLGDLAQVTTGFPFRGKVLPEEGGDLAVLQIKDLSTQGELDLATALRIHSNRTHHKHLLMPGDVLLQSRGTQNPVAVFDSSTRAIAALGLHIIRLQPNVLRPEFLFWYLNHPKTQERLRDVARGSTVAFIAKSDAEDFAVPVPPLALQTQVITVDRLRRQERRLAAQADRLRNEYIDTVTWQAASSDRTNKA
jgi:hypothetical protein